MYILTWKNPAIDPGKALSISVPVGTTVANASSLVFTGKGAANYGKHQQENLMRLLENFADTTSPDYPTVGQIWYDSAAKILNVCTSTAPLTWSGINGIQVTQIGDPAPASATLGTLWFERTGSLSGNLYVYTGLGRFPLSATSNGGWDQIWPRVDAAALREEYEEMFALVDSLLGPATNTGNVIGGGASVIGTLFDDYTDFDTLDADLLTTYSGSPDTNIALSNNVELRAQPVSHDWDYLLATARWMVDRLDLPATMADDVSSIPFVQDGRQIPASLQVYPYTDVRSPSEERRNGRRYGSVTTMRLYAETMNVLSIAQGLRYTLRGIAGASGVNSSFSPDVATWAHCSRGGTWTGGTSAVVNTTFRFNNNVQRNAFINGGNAIEVVVTHAASASPTAQDNDFNTFLSANSTFRLTGDKLRTFGASLPLTMTAAPSSVGLANVVSTAGTTSIGTRSAAAGTGVYSIAFTGTRATGTFNVNVTLSAPAGLTGTTTVAYRVIKDVTAYGPSVIDVFPSPIAYNSGTDATGTTAVMANIAVTTVPVANFSVNATSGTAGVTPFTFTWTGVGTPTLIEWDFEGTGTFTATGATPPAHVYVAPGLKTVRVRATNAGGYDVLTRVGYISVT